MTNVKTCPPLFGSAAVLAGVCLTSMAVAAPHAGSPTQSQSFSRDTTTKTSAVTSHGLRTVSTTVDATGTVTRTVTGVSAGTVSGTLTRDVTGTFTKTIVSPHGRTRVVTGTFDTTGTGSFSRARGIATRSIDDLVHRDATFTVDTAGGSQLSSGTVLRNANVSNVQTFRTLVNRNIKETFSRSVAASYTVTPNGGTAIKGGVNRSARSTMLRVPEVLGGGQSGYRYTASTQGAVSRTRAGLPVASYTFAHTGRGNDLTTPGANGGFTTTDVAEGQATRVLPNGRTVVRMSTSLQRIVYTPTPSPVS